MAEFVAAQASVLIVPTLGKGANNFGTKLREQLKTVKASVDVEVKAKTAAAIAEIEAAKKLAEKDPINLSVKVDKNGFRELTRNVTEIRRQYNSVRDDMKAGLALNLKIAGVEQLSALIPAMASVNASIVELSQSALLLPGILSAVAASVGTVAWGIRGLSDAFKEQAKAQKNAVQSAKQQKDANRAVRDSMRDLNRAVKDAKRNIEDLNAQLRDAPLDEAEAMLNLQEAQYEASQKLGKSAFEQQKDQLRLAKAEADLAETRRRNIRLSQDVAEANQKGVAGTDAVVQAQERLGAALDTVAQKSDAMSDLADAMGKLSPNAQAFVNSIQSVFGMYSGLQNAVQDRLFANLGSDVEALASKSLPMLERGLGGIATAINGNVRTAIAALSADGNQNFLSRIFGNTADAQRLLDGAVTPLLNSFLHLGAVGTEYLPRISAAFGNIMQRFEAFVNRADADGSLDKWINNGMKALTQLGNSLLNVGSIVKSIADAFTASGGKSFGQVLQETTKKWADFLKSSEGQQRWITFFQDARAEFAQWKPVLQDIPGILKSISDAASNWAQMMLPFFRTASSLLKEHPGLVQAVFYAYAAWKTLTPIFSAVKAGLDGVQAGIAKIKEKTDGANGTIQSVKNLAAALGPQVLLYAATAVATYFVGQFVSGMNEGQQAMDRARAKADELKNSLDLVTGAATTASRALIYGQLQNDSNTATGEQANNIEGLRNRGVNPGDITSAIAQGDRAKVDQLLAPVVGATARTVEDSDIWKENQEWMQDAGLTPQLVADAINGKPDAIQKFKDATNTNGVGASASFLRGLEKTGLIDIPDLLDFRNQLPSSQQEGARIRGAVEEKLNNAVSGSAGNAQASRDLYGNLTLNETGRSLFGADAQVNGSASGATIRMPGTINPQVRADIEANGGRVLAAGEGPDSPVSGTLIELKKDRAARYVQGMPAYAGGGMHGMLSGPGTGMSDSMLARVSNGEYIVKAASVAKYGPSFFDKLNAGELPKFSGGGLLGDLIAPTDQGGGALSSGLMGLLSGSGSGSVTTGSLPGILSGSNTSGVTGPAQVAGTVPSAVPALDSGPSGTSSISGPSAPLSTSVPGLASPGVAAGGGPTDMVPGLLPPPLAAEAPSPDATGMVPGLAPVAPDHLGNGAGSPGPGNGPVDAGAGLLGMFGGGGKSPTADQNWGILDFLRPESMMDFFSGMAQNIGSSLLDIGLGFLSGITGFDFKGLISPFMQVGDHFTGLFGDLTSKDSQSGPTEANPLVQATLNSWAGAPSSYLGTSIYGNGAYDPSALTAAMNPGNAGAIQAPGGMFLGLPGGSLPGYLLAGGSAASSAGVSGANGNKAFADQMAARWQALGFDAFDHAADNHKEHQNGAIDIRISDAIGAEPTAAQRARGNQLVQQILQDPNVYGVIFDNKAYYGGNRAGNPYAGADPTNGHRDHIHVWYQPGRSGNFGPTKQQPQGYASGGLLSGPGTGTSDSIMARVSNGEFITKASSVAKYGRGFFDQLNAGHIDPSALPGFADGTPPVQQPLPPPAPTPPPPMAPGAGAPSTAGDSPVAGATGEQPSLATDTANQAVGDALSGLGGALGSTGDGGMSPPSALGPQPNTDQRAVLGSAPTNLDHNLSAVSTGINSAASTVGSAIGAAIGAASTAGGAAAPGAGAAGGAASSLAASGAQIAGTAINGAVNILSSLLVGTATPGGSQSAGAYGAPLAPGPTGNPLHQQGPGIVNNYGDIHTANYDEFYKGQQRREAQQQAPLMPMRR